MSADDRIEMDEDMAEFWAEVKDRLPGLLGRDGFVSAYPLADPGDVDIFTSWWNQKEEHIASLYHYPRVPTGAEKKEKWEYEPCFNLLVDEPGTDGRTLTDVTPKQVAGVIEKRAADQVRQHLPGAWTTGDYFEWDESIIADFCDYACEAKNMGEFTEYVQERADKTLARRALTTMVDYLLLEEVPFTVAVFPALGMSNINLPERVIKIRTDRGRAEVALSTREGTNLGDVDITMGSRGVSYPFCAMTGLINAAVSGGRSEEEEDR
jgi:hypothetical protein